jgi:hypothetical protein
MVETDWLPRISKIASLGSSHGDRAAHRGQLPCHPCHTWKLLRHRLHYRLLRLARRAIERDERAIARWVAEDWA